ncbi:hypothetical protein MTO96_023558 [Rhipicephalus appendiculatus]
MMHEEMTDEAIISSVCEAGDPNDPKQLEKRMTPQDVFNARDTVSSFFGKHDYDGALFTMPVKGYEVAARKGSANGSFKDFPDTKFCEVGPIFGCFRRLLFRHAGANAKSSVSTYDAIARPLRRWGPPA